MFLSKPAAVMDWLDVLCYFGTMCFQIQVYDYLGTYGFPNGIVKLPGLVFTLISTNFVTWKGGGQRETECIFNGEDSAFIKNQSEKNYCIP